MMQKLLADGAGYIFILVGIVVTVTVGVMSILLPFIVFKIMADVSAMNKKLNKVISLLSEGVTTREPHGQHAHQESRLGPTASPGYTTPGSQEKPLRMK